MVEQELWGSVSMYVLYIVVFLELLFFQLRWAEADAIPEQTHVPGVVRMWKPIPEFTRVSIPVNLSLGPSVQGAVADLDCDGRDELLLLKEDTLHMLGFSRLKELRHVSFPLPDSLGPVAMLAGNFDGEGCGDIAFVQRERKRIVLSSFQREKSSLTYRDFEVGDIEATTGPLSRTLGWRQKSEIVFVSKNLKGLDEATSVEIVSGKYLRRKGVSLIQRTDFEIIGFIDHLGSGVQSLLQRGKHEYFPGSHNFSPAVWITKPTEDPVYQKMWKSDDLLLLGELSNIVSWPHSLIGDFNGDLREDVIAIANQPAMAWILISSEQGSAEQPLAISPSSGHQTYVGDMNGDGFDDLVEVSGSNVVIQFSVPGKVVSHQHVTCGTTTLSDETGRFAIPYNSQLTTEPCRVIVDKSSSLFSSETQILPAYRRNRPMNVFLVEPASAPTGQNSSLSGPVPGPYLCTGYSSDLTGSRRWGRKVTCPDDHVMFELDDGALQFGLCCKLPSQDILTDNVTISETGHCPVDALATGFEPGQDRTSLRCTFVNKNRYQLSQPLRGVYWGAGLSAPSRRAGISRLEIPPWLRFGVGRMGTNNWDVDGCISADFSSVLVGRTSGDCSRALFAKILDRDTLEPIEIFPHCLKVANEFDPLTGCLEKGQPLEAQRRTWSLSPGRFERE